MHDGERVDEVEQKEPEARRIAELEAQLAATTSQLATTTTELARLRQRYQAALEKLALAERRILLGKAERRVDDAAAQLSLEGAFAELKELEKQINDVTGGAISPPPGTPPAPPSSPKVDGRKHRKTPPTGRRDLAKSALPVVELEITDPELEGKAERVGFKLIQRLGHQRGGSVRVLARLVVYKQSDDTAGIEVGPTQSDDAAGAEVAPSQSDDTADTKAPTVTPMHDAGTIEPKPARFVTAPMPKELLRRGLLAPSMIAHLLVQKYVMGVPFHRLEQKLDFEQFPLDRATMCRYAEHIGATLGAIVEAARAHFIARAFCLSTDATGAAIQPEPLPDGKRQACRKGHFFVTLADRDHIFFDYQSKHDSLAVWTMFKGYSGYIQADAHVIYDALFRGTAPKGAEETEEEANKRGPPPKEVACWSHGRRKFWEAAVCGHLIGLAGLRRVNDIFAADALLADLAPAQRKVQRDLVVRPLVDEFFVWAKAEKAKLVARGLVATALGYMLNHEDAFRRFLEDGRLVLENNRAERALRPIATARKAWLFFGSDDHASAAANLFSLVASCKLHGLDPEAYLADVIRVMPYWPRDRYLELAPKFWAVTRAKLDVEEMRRQLGPVTAPPAMAAEEQTSTG